MAKLASTIRQLIAAQQREDDEFLVPAEDFHARLGGGPAGREAVEERKHGPVSPENGV